MRRNEPTPEEQEVEEMKQAARVIKEICDRRTADDACSFCPFYDMCRTEPYTWEVPRSNAKKSFSGMSGCRNT